MEKLSYREFVGHTAKMNRPLHFFAVFTTVCTFILLCSGGLVTSKGVGMAVPDWPTTYGYNMFLFPISRWVGGVFYEHTHRLMASGIGLFTLILSAWILATEKRYWIRILGIVAFLGVVLQGVLGGLRVTLNANFMGIFHGMVAQSFLCLLGILALVTSPWFLSGKYTAFRVSNKLKWMVLAITVLIFFQLGVATSMRHSHAGLAIRDFPAAYGKWWPSTDTASIAKINQERASEGQVATTATQITLQMVHRILALLIFAGILSLTYVSRKYFYLKYFAAIWALLICAQILLGAWTIWSNKAADVATTHMAVGALLLFLGVQMTFLLFCSSEDEAFKTLRTSYPEDIEKHTLPS